MSGNDHHFWDSDKTTHEKNINDAHTQGQRDGASGKTGIFGTRPMYGSTEALGYGVSDKATEVTDAYIAGYNHGDCQK